MRITGRKGGGGGGHTPVESPDSVQSVARAKLLLALGEGEFAGGLDGTHIYLDGTPLIGADGTENFTDVKWEFRAGTQAQEYIQGVPSVENEIAIGTELKSSSPWVRSVSNTQLSAIRLRFGWPSLQKQEDNGDVNGYRIEYAVDVSTDGGSYQEMLNTAIDGKTTTLYERSHRINLPKATIGWQVRVRRLTENASSNRIADKMNIVAIDEVIDAKLRYPNTALLYVEFDSKQFQSPPKISCEPRGRVVRVPVNYDPDTRTYSGTWDGTFTWAWSNNPAWVFYDIVLSERFGLGQRLTPAQVDKWELYRIAQYCDQLVPDGRGGSDLEPRFTCDVYIQSQNDAWTVMRDLAAIFRGMTYWSNNQFCTLADMPRDMDYVYTRANVVEGKFTYASASEKTRYSTAMVSWSDPLNNYQDAIEAVSDNDLVRRYGVNQLDLTAIGCTRQTEANRRGRWALLTNSKDRIVSFSVGLDGMIPLPGHIVGVADQMLSGRIMGGRIHRAEGRNITLDRAADVKAGDRLVVNLPDGTAQGRTVQAVNQRTVTVTAAYSMAPQPECVWSVDADDLAIQQYRVTGISDNGDNTYSISAVQHDPDKYARIDSGARIDQRPISIMPPGVQMPPSDVVIDSYSKVEQGLAVTTLRVTWAATVNAIAYEAEWRRDNGNWIAVARATGLGFDVPAIYAGRYQARVRAINAGEISSIWANAPETRLNGKEGAPAALADFTAAGMIFGIALNWAFPAAAEDTLKTEVWYSTSASGADEMLLGDIPFPNRSHTLQGLAAGQTLWFKARLVDRSGNQGPWTEWMKGQSSADAGLILDYIAGQIGETELARDILSRIEDAATREELDAARQLLAAAIDALDGDVAAANSALEKAKAELIAADAALGKRVDAANQALELAKADLTTADVELGKRVDAASAALNSARHELAAADAALGQRVDASTAALSEAKASLSQRIDEVNEKAGEADQALSESVHQVQTAADQTRARLDLTAEAVIENALGIDREVLERKSRDAEIVRRQDIMVDDQQALARDVVQLSANFDGQQAQITDVRQTVADEKQATAQVIGQLKSTVDSDRAVISGRVTDLQQTVADGERALAEQITGLGSSFAVEQGKTNASVTQLGQTLAQADSALATRVDDLQSTVGENAASLVSESTTRASADTALGRRIDTLSASVTAGDILLQGNIDTLAQVVADADSAQASRTERLQVSIDKSAEAVIDNALNQDVEKQRQRGINAQIVNRQEVFADLQQAQASVLQSLRAEFEGAQGQLSDLRETTASADAALAGRISTAQAAVEGNAAALATEIAARADADGALGQRVDSVAAKTDRASSDITQLQKTVADGDSALATRIDGLQTTVGQNGAALTSEATARANADVALGQRIDAVVSTSGGNSAAIASEAATRASADGALGTRIDAVTATAGGNKAAIAAESSARAEGDVAVAKQVTDLRADMQTADSQLQGNITQLTQVVADSSQVLAQRADRLEVSVEQTAAAAIENALNLDQREQINRQAFARITNDQQVTASEVKAQAQVLQQLDVGLGNATGQIADLKRSAAEADAALSERISTTQAAVGDNAAAIASEATTRADGDTALGQRIDSVSSKTDKATADITQLQKTVADGDSALATRIDGLQTTVGQNGTAITSEATARANADVALGQRIDAVVSTAGGNTAAIASEAATRASADGALGTRIDAVTATAGSNKAAIAAESTARAEGDAAVAKQVTDLRTDMQTADSQLQGNITQLTQVVADSSQVLAQRADRLEVSVDQTAATAIENALNLDQRGQINRLAFARITNDQQVTASEVKAQAQVLQQLDVGLGKATGQIADLKRSAAEADAALSERISTTQAAVGGNTAAIASEVTARADGDTALGQRIDSVSSKTDKATADITQLQKTVADGDSALATRIDAVTATAGENKAAVQQVSQAQATLNGKLSASWNLKVNTAAGGNNYVAGLGLGIEPDGKSQFLVQADRMALINTANGNITTPFAIQNGQTFINSAVIADGSIANAKIGDYIQSNNYLAGASGWKINKSGEAEFQNGRFRGHVEATSGTFSGTLNAVDGNFKGTVLAEKIDGEISNTIMMPDIMYSQNSSGGAWEKRHDLTIVGGYRYSMLVVIDFDIFISRIDERCILEVRVVRDGVDIYVKGTNGKGGSTESVTSKDFNNRIVVKLNPGEVNVKIEIIMWHRIHGVIEYSLKNQTISIFKTIPSSISFNFNK